jgi:hypothetical protein
VYVIQRVLGKFDWTNTRHDLSRVF